MAADGSAATRGSASKAGSRSSCRRAADRPAPPGLPGRRHRAAPGWMPRCAWRRWRHSVRGPPSAPGRGGSGRRPSGRHPRRTPAAHAAAATMPGGEPGRPAAAQAMRSRMRTASGRTLSTRPVHRPAIARSAIAAMHVRQPRPQPVPAASRQPSGPWQRFDLPQQGGHVLERRGRGQDGRVPAAIFQSPALDAGDGGDQDRLAPTDRRGGDRTPAAPGAVALGEPAYIGRIIQAAPRIVRRGGHADPAAADIGVQRLARHAEAGRCLFGGEPARGRGGIIGWHVDSLDQD